MGIFCEINLNTPEGGKFISGSVLSGEIKYAVDKNTVFKKITVSLKGIGTTSIEYNNSNKDEKKSTDHYTEKYVNIEQILLDKAKDDDGTTLKIGSYTAAFQFNIPNRIPPSVNIYRSDTNHTVRYKVNYYITIKFQRPGLISFPKRYKKDIQIVSNIIPTLSQTPVTLGEKKKLFHIFSRRDSVINLKATILNSVVRAGGNVQFLYELANHSNVKIKYVKMKIVEYIEFKKSRRSVSFYRDLDATETKTGSIQSGNTQQMTVEISVPDDALTIDSCKLAARDYYVYIVVALPLPHINFYLRMPIQVMLSTENVPPENPPSYWDVMCEDKDHEDD
ncbi:uncharacterized protein LOC119836455 [Zerene cesonia]|uniref:uncharacterized protein LOC119836455 n=1 Tax=Zerene cesonia TaxID=33412 RepID=UPI0018E4F0F1|nr:uncharacterized protein LOC119836455 [Zerene cesonia]